MRHALLIMLCIAISMDLAMLKQNYFEEAAKVYKARKEEEAGFIVSQPVQIPLKITFLNLEVTRVDRLISIPQEAVPYVDEFESQWRMRIDPAYRIDSLYVGFTNDMGDDDDEDVTTIGQCWSYSVPYVVLLKKWWDEATSLEKENLVFHELGHCLLQRDHENGMLKGKRHKSIMNYQIMTPKEYTPESRENYLEELFWQVPGYIKYRKHPNTCEGVYSSGR